MKVLWVHDHIFLTTPSGKVYSPGKLPYNTWKRYLEIFDKLHVIGRCQELNHHLDSSNLILSSGENVQFSFTPSLNTLKSFIFHRHKVGCTIHQIIKNIDAVIVRLPSFNGELAIKAALIEKKPYAVELVACAWDGFWNYGNWKGRTMAPRGYLVNKQLVKKAPFVLYVSNKFLQKRYPCHGVNASVPNVELSKLRTATLNNQLKRIQINRPLTIGLIASLKSKIKGIQVAIKALRTVVERESKVSFKILGEGNTRPWLEIVKKNYLADHVEFSGTLPSGQAVFEWLDTVDLYIQPSFTEGLPRALIEAMSRACPSLGSTAGGIPELLPPECLHKPGDYKKLAADILKACQEPEWRKKMAKRNFEIAKKYRKDILDAKRARFWKNFAEYVRECK